MSRLTTLLTLTLAGLSTLCSAEELPTDALIRGINQAGRTIQNGEVSAIVTIKHAARKTEKEIEVWKQTERKRELERLKSRSLFPNVGLKEFEEEIRAPQLEFQANVYREHIEIQHVTSLFQLLSTHPYLYQYKLTVQEVQGLSLDSQNARHSQDSMFFILAHDSQKQVKQNIGNAVSAASPGRSVEFYKTSMEHFGMWNFSLYAEPGTSIPPGAKCIGEERVDSTLCQVLEYTNGLFWHLWVEITDKNFSVRKAESRKEKDGPLRSQHVYKQFEQFGNIWSPKVTESIYYGEDGAVRIEYRTEITTAQFNVDFPENFFDIDRDFYYQPRSRRHSSDPLPDSGQGPAKRRTEVAERLLLCGPKSLLRICERLNVQTNISELKKLTGFDPNRGTTMLGLKRAATFKGLAPKGVKTPLTQLKRKKVPLPAIAYVDGSHFLVFEAVNKDGVEISDPAQKYNPSLTWEKLSEIWNGELLIFDKKKARKGKPKQMVLAVAETPEYDFGRALGGSKIEHTFILKNIGQKRLKILSVTETCVCTATILSQDEIPAGGTGNISAILTVPSRNERVRESLLVLTDAPTQSTLTLTLMGQAFIPLTTFPERLSIGNQKPLQEPLTKRVSLHIQEGVQILGVRTDSEHLKATLETDTEIPYANLQLQPTFPIGQFSQNLLVDYTYKGKQTTHNVVVYGQILGELRVVPNQLFFGMVKEPSAVSKTITISARDAQPFQITSVESRTKEIVFKITADESETRSQVTISIAPTTEPGELSGDIVIHTSSTLQPTLRVPFFGILAHP